MNQLGFPFLSIVLFLPLLGAVSMLLLGSNRTAAKAGALTVTGLDLILVCVLWGFFDGHQAELQFVDRLIWIEPLGISYLVGVDGVSLWFLFLTTLLYPIAVVASWRFLDKLPKADASLFLFFLLLLETGVLGVFTAADLVLFYLFWEAVLIPAYFLIGRWGGRRRVYAAIKFLLYTMAGSVLMLVALIALAVLHVQHTGVWTFDLTALVNLPIPWVAQLWLFLAFALAFAVKSPLWPFHTWLPDAYGESVAPVTILLAGVLSKMGIYGLIRFCLPLFPDAVAAARPWVWLMAIVGILYGSLVALVQRDMKQLAAYSSLAHMNLILAGVLAANAQGIQGALLQSVSHGLTIAAFFLVVDLLEMRRGTRLIAEYGGLWKNMPRFGGLFLIVIMASIGLPGLSGFPGEFTLLVGIFQESMASAIFATLGIVLGAWYMLNLFRHTFTGPLERAENRAMPDLHRRELAAVLPVVALMFVLGIFPNLILKPTQATVHHLLDLAQERRVVWWDESGRYAWQDQTSSVVFEGE